MGTSVKKSKKGKSAGGTALCYGLDADSEKGKKLRAVFRDMGVKVKEIGTELLLEKVGYLAGTQGFESTGEVFSGQAPDCEFLLLKGFPDPRLTELFTRMRKAEVGKIGRKAVVTETNRDWTFLQLIEEIGKEESALAKTEKAVEV